jgi:DNA-binding protein H-NS
MKKIVREIRSKDRKEAEELEKEEKARKQKVEVSIPTFGKALEAIWASYSSEQQKIVAN